MSPRTTIREVAAAAGVSLGTASRALSGSGAVAPETRERVLAAAAELDFRPNGHARSLRSSHSKSVGLLIPDVRNPYFAQLAHEVELDARSRGVSTLLCNADEDPDQLRHYVEVLRERRVDGVIVAPFLDAEKSLTRLRADGIPTVYVDRFIPGSDTASVTGDTAEAIGQAVGLLASLGHTVIGCISGPEQTSTGRERRQQIEDAAQAQGLDLVTVQGDFQEESGRRGADELLRRGVAAIIAADSLMTLGALRACRAHGVTLGSDIDLIGFDDIPVFTLTTPTMTVIDQDIERMAHEATAMLAALQAGEDVTSVRLPATLVVRGSTRAAPR